MLTGIEIFAAVSCGIALGETISCLVRYGFHRRTLADLARHHHIQMAEISAAHRLQRDEIAETIMKVKRGAEIIPLVRHWCPTSSSSDCSWRGASSTSRLSRGG